MTRLERHGGALAQALAIIGAFGSKAAAAGAQFGQAIILSRMLGPEALGLYYVALSVYRVAETAAPLGLPTSIVREVAAASAQGGWGSVRRITRRGLVLCAFLAAAAAVAIWALADTLAGGLEGQPRAALALRWMALAIMPGVMALALTSVLRGLGRQSLANLLGSLVLPVVATLGFVFLWRSHGYVGAVQGFIAGQIAALALLGASLWQILRRRPNIHVQGRRLRESALAFWIVSLASLANDSLAILMLGFLATPEQAGYFGIAARLAMPLSFLGASVQAVCDSRFAGLHRLGDQKALARDYHAALRGAFGFSLVAVLGLLLLLGPLIALFGPQYAAARPILYVILVSIFLLSAFGPAGSLLTMTGHARINAWTAVAAMPAMALAMALLVPRFGAMGAALATSGTLSARVLVQLAAAQLVIRRGR
ncbi:MAG: lipopolysaccharide biosynthesis protein [Chakrabartia sp.]